MSTTVETNTATWSKRLSNEKQLAQMKRISRNYYYRLESESSKASEEDSESVYSLQDQETDLCRDTTDTDTDNKGDEYELFEYEVASLSESDVGIQDITSSDSEDHAFLAAAVEAICDSSLETWITDCEESDNSSLDDSFITRSGFSRCVQCKSENGNPLYRYCEKCFQDRKKFFPPRPKGNKKTRKPSTKKSHSEEPPVKLDLLRSCLSVLSQDSGIGSSQECPPLGLDQIIVPDDHLRTDDPSPASTVPPTPISTPRKRKRDLSESSLSEDVEPPKKPKPERPTTLELGPPASSESSGVGSFGSTTSTEGGGAIGDLCIFCNSAPKDSIFLHTNVAHQCCCYRCAKRILHTIKRCPICNRSVNKVVRIFTS